jgi:hypothetical protein
MVDHGDYARMTSIWGALPGTAITPGVWGNAIERRRDRKHGDYAGEDQNMFLVSSATDVSWCIRPSSVGLIVQGVGPRRPRAHKTYTLLRRKEEDRRAVGARTGHCC